jgi:hypothetical protein
MQLRYLPSYFSCQKRDAGDYLLSSAEEDSVYFGSMGKAPCVQVNVMQQNI